MYFPGHTIFHQRLLNIGLNWIPQYHLFIKQGLNPNYVAIVKQDTNKLFVVSFIKLVEEMTWLLPIVVIPRKNGKLRIFVDFRKLNVAIKKDPYPLPFTNEVINIVDRHKIYTFLDKFSRYHQISITPKDWHKITFVIDWGVLCGL
jgi:hypothetical protein